MIKLATYIYIVRSDKEDIENVSNNSVEDVRPPAWAPDSPIYVSPANFSSPDIPTYIDKRPTTSQ